MRPGTALKLTLSSARNVPKLLLRPRASFTAPIADLIRSGCGVAAARAGSCSLQQVGGFQSKPGDRRDHLRPFVLQETLALVLHQHAARAFGDEHAAPAAFLHQLLVDQLLIALEHREWIELVLRSHVAH